MIHLKSPQEIEHMKVGGAILRKAVEKLIPLIQVGMSTNEVDSEAERLIREEGGEPSFTRVKGYKWTTCLPINEQAVHTPPSARIIQNGDVLTLDIGVYYEQLHTDYATSFIVGSKKDPKLEDFLRVGQTTLENAIAQIQKGVRLGTIGAYIHQEITQAGYFILKDLTGHGVGRELHEDPYVFNYVDRPIEKTYEIPSGLTIAVEIIYSMGTEQIAYEPGVPWSIISKDRSISACFERSIAVSDKETFILT